MDIVYNELFFSAAPMSSTRCIGKSESVSRIMYTSLYLFNKCVKSVNCLWIWKVENVIRLL